MHRIVTLLAVFLVVAVWIANKAEVLLGSGDAGSIVIDEMSGFVVSLLWHPLKPLHLCLAFVLFRFFDILKPPPLGLLERRLRGGWGVVMDDVMAGLYTNISLWILATILSNT